MTASNETIFKSSLSLFDDLEYVVAKNRLEKDEIIGVFKRHGIAELDGRPIDDVVKTKAQMERIVG